MGQKTIEVRSWHPGKLPLRNLLIVENSKYLSSDRPVDPDGRAVALVDVIAVHNWLESEIEAACSSGWQDGYLAWVLTNVRPLSGNVVLPARLQLYEVETQLPTSV